MLRVADLTVRYGSVTAVRGVSLELNAAEILTVVGPNGAGKSSMLLAIAGGLGMADVGGSIRLDGEELVRMPPEQRVRKGIGLVPEGRRIFDSLTVAENLVVAASARSDRAEARRDSERLLERFPALRDSLTRPAGLLSGGQQQQLALMRALLNRPRVLLLDEPSLGLAPVVIDEVFEILAGLREEGIAMMLLEQNALQATEIADRVLLLRNGRVEALATGTANDRAMIATYFGLDADGAVA